MKRKHKDNTMPDRSRPGLTTAALSTAVHQGGSDKLTTGAQTKPSIKLASKEFTIGIWNVRTLYTCGRVQELEYELKRYRWNIVGLSEVRWTGFGETKTDEGHTIWHSGKDTRHEHGVAFMVHKDTTKHILSCTPVSSRLITIRIAASPKNITIIQVYAPTSDYDDQDIDEFYEEIERVMRNTPKKDIIIIQGDFNAKIGPDSYEQWSGTVGKFTLGQTNERGLRLLEFAEQHNLTIANTLHPNKASRITTWHSPDGKTHNQIDFFLTPKRFKSCISKAKTRTYPGADIGSDHDLVLMNIKIKLKKKPEKENPRIRFDLEKLKDPKINDIYKAEIGGKFSALSFIDNDIDEMTTKFNEIMKTTSEEILGKQRKRNKPWITNETLDLCDKRRELKKTKSLNDDKFEEYTKVNKQVRRKIREDKNKWLEEQCQIIDLGMSHGNSKIAHDTLKKLTKPRKSVTSAIEDKDGKLLTEKEAVLNRWREYCQDLYNYQISPDPNVLEETQPPTKEPSPLPILREEVEEAIRKLPVGKSPGPDNIPAELIKNGGEEVLNLLTQICQKIWQTKQWPSEWTTSLIIPIPKKGNSKQCQNFRTISLINHASKVMLRIILNRLRSAAEEHLAEEQAGFRENRSTVEQIFTCRIMMEKHIQHQKPLFHNFIDFKKAFDRVWHDGLWKTLREFGMEEGMIQVIQSLYKNSSSAILLQNQTSTPFNTTVGVRQGCLLSPTLFNLYLEKIMRETLFGFKSTISLGGRTINNLRFADDIDLMASSNQELQELTNNLVKHSARYGMEVSSEKSKTMVNGELEADISMTGVKLEAVESFKYLGSTLSNDGKSEKEIRARMGMASNAMARLQRIWKSSNIKFSTKYHLYKSLILSTLLYGCETWTISAQMANKIQAFENKSMRRLLGISWKDRKTNQYVYEKVANLTEDKESLLTIIKRRKLAWYGHINRHNGLPKTVLQGTLEGARKRGRQRKSWLDNIKEWTRMESPELIRLAEDRPRWQHLSRKASLMSPLRPLRSGE